MFDLANWLATPTVTVRRNNRGCTFSVRGSFLEGTGLLNMAAAR